MHCPWREKNQRRSRSSTWSERERVEITQIIKGELSATLDRIIVVTSYNILVHARRELVSLLEGITYLSLISFHPHKSRWVFLSLLGVFFSCNEIFFALLHISQVLKMVDYIICWRGRERGERCETEWKGRNVRRLQFQQSVAERETRKTIKSNFPAILISLLISFASRSGWRMLQFSNSGWVSVNFHCKIDSRSCHFACSSTFFFAVLISSQFSFLTATRFQQTHPPCPQGFLCCDVKIKISLLHVGKKRELSGCCSSVKCK